MIYDNIVKVSWLDVKTSTQDYADSSNNLNIQICQDQKCCTTGTLTGSFDKGSTKKFSYWEIGECRSFELNSKEDIDVTFNQLTKDGWRGELLSIATITKNTIAGKDAIVKYECPITTWLDVDPTEGYSSSFKTSCKVASTVDYDYYSD